MHCAAVVKNWTSELFNVVTGEEISLPWDLLGFFGFVFVSILLL